VALRLSPRLVVRSLLGTDLVVPNVPRLAGVGGASFLDPQDAERYLDSAYCSLVI
jgi:hypothetical protein